MKKDQRKRLASIWRTVNAPRTVTKAMVYMTLLWLLNRRYNASGVMQNASNEGRIDSRVASDPRTGTINKAHVNSAVSVEPSCLANRKVPSSRSEEHTS